MFSVVVCVGPKERKIHQCLESLYNQAFPKEMFEIVVIDNGSNCKGELGSHSNVKYYYEARKGLGYARNLGVRKAAKNNVAFLDAHCIASRNWLYNLHKTLLTPEVGGCGGKIIFPKPKSIFEVYQKKTMYNQKWAIEGNDFGLPFIMGGNCCFEKSALKDAGYFEEKDCFGVEDMDMSWRIQLNKLRVLYSEDAIVVHPYTENLYSMIIQYVRYGVGLQLLSKKYREHEVIKIHSIYVHYSIIMRRLETLIRYLLKLNGEATLFGYYDVVKGLSSLTGRVLCKFGMKRSKWK